MGYIERETPFGENPKDSKRSLYRLRDRFMNTYYHFYAPNASLVATGASGAVMRIVESSMPSFVGHSWEKICQQAVSGHEIDGVVYDVARRWWGSALDPQSGKPRQFELDVVALSLDRQHLLLGECMWAEADYAGCLFDQLNEKAALFPVPKSVRHVHTKLFLKEPPLDNLKDDVFLPEEVVAMCDVQSNA